MDTLKEIFATVDGNVYMEKPTEYFGFRDGPFSKVKLLPGPQIFVYHTFKYPPPLFSRNDVEISNILRNELDVPEVANAYSRGSGIIIPDSNNKLQHIPIQFYYVE